MAHTTFVSKITRDKLFATEWNSLTTALNNLEEALVITPGSTTMAIPNSKIASLDGAKLLNSSVVSVQSLGATSLSISSGATLSGATTLGTTGAISVNNGSIDIIKIGRINVGDYGMLVSDGSNTNLRVSNAGALSIRGVVTSLSGSSLTGSVDITGGIVSGTLTMGGASGISLSPNTISLGSNGTINSGTNSLSNANGFIIRTGDFNIASGVFIVSAAGKLTSTNAEITGKATLTSGYVGGITINTTSISAGGFSLTNQGVMTIGDGDFTGTATLTGGIITGDLTVTGTITAGTSVISEDGISLANGSTIDMGSGVFTVSALGLMQANSAIIHGEIYAESGSFDGDVTAGTTTIGPGGISVGAGGIQVTGVGGISILNGGDLGVDGDINIYEGALKVHAMSEYGDPVVITIGHWDNEYGMLVNDGSKDTLKIDKFGNVTMSGTLVASTGTFTGEVNATSGDFGDVNVTGDITLTTGSIVVDANTYISSSGITIGTGSINLGSGNFIVDSAGALTALDATVTGDINATSGYFSGAVTIGLDGLVLDGATGEIQWGNGSKIDSDSITINEGTITIGQFSVDASGYMSATSASISGEIYADSGVFGVGVGAIHADATGIYTGSGVGQYNSSFWINSGSAFQDPRDPTKTIQTGDSYFKGSISFDADSVLNDGDIIIQNGRIVAGDPNGAHISISYHEDYGGQLYSQDENSAQLFKVNQFGAEFSGKLSVTGDSSVLGTLDIGAGGNVRLDGPEESIFLYGNIAEGTEDKVIRLNSLGLYVSNAGGVEGSFIPAITGGGVNPGAITDGILYITDMEGNGASGISVRQNVAGVGLVENINISPAGINIYNGSITIYSDTTGEVLIGGGYLRVKGLDMGVVTTNNFVGNGSFSMVSNQWGILQENSGEIFLGTSHSSGGAVTNPSYHYVGWPDNLGAEGIHELWTYDLNSTTGIPSTTPSKKVRAPFNPQWAVTHPTYEYTVCPGDADVFITIVDKDGDVYRNLRGYKSGYYAASFTPDGTKMIVPGDDLDRKRAPWDVAVFDTSDPDPMNWFLIGVVGTGEFACSAACSNNHAFVSVSWDSALYKINLNTLQIEDILDMTGIALKTVRVILDDPDTPGPTSRVLVTGVRTRKIYSLPLDWTGITFQAYILAHPEAVIEANAWIGQRGVLHDFVVSNDNQYVVIADASVTDGCVTLRKISDNTLVSWIGGYADNYVGVTDFNGVNMSLPENVTAMRARLAWVPLGGTPTQDEIATYNSKWTFRSSTGIAHHPSKKIVYVSCTNRCTISALSYETGVLVEIARVTAGSNPTTGAVSTDGSKLYIPNHHYHTYPLGANRVWGYDSDADNFYASPDVYDTTQKYYYQNPAGMVLTNEDRYLWVANRATNSISRIDTQGWTNYIDDTDYDENANIYTTIENVGNKPYEMVLTTDGSKIIVANDDSDNLANPDYITVVDVATRLVEGRIYVGDRPVGIETYNDGTEYIFAACLDGGMVQKINLETRRVIASAYVGGKPKHLHRNGTNLYVVDFENNLLHCIHVDTMLPVVIQGVTFPITTLTGPTQMAFTNDKLYIVCQGADKVSVYSTIDYTKIIDIKVGSMPGPIAYNADKDKLYVGNSGEGSICLIDPDTNVMEGYLMTGDTPEFICISSDGGKWYTTAHGPRDIVSYGTGTPFIGDAYLDSESKTHLYGAEYWVPSRSAWYRADDNSLTSFSSIEFLPKAQMEDKQGYAHITVMGIFNAHAQIEQDIYPLTNNSDGASEHTTEILEFIGTTPIVLTQEIANVDDISLPAEKNIIVTSATDPSVVYIKDSDYAISYSSSSIAKVGSAIPASIIEEIVLGSSPTSFTADLSDYNDYTVYQHNAVASPYVEGVDYTLDINADTITMLNSALSGHTVDVHCKHLCSVRYYYHAKKRNYSDLVLSADFLWRWPRPESQWVYMDIDEMVPKFITVDNDQLVPWTPSWDRVGEEYKGLRYSAMSDRMDTAVTTVNGTILSGTIDMLKEGTGYLELDHNVAGASISINLGAVYYVNEITITFNHTPANVANAKVEISETGLPDSWTTVYDQVSAPAEITISFPETYDGSSYNTSRRVRYIKSTQNNADPVTNIWHQVSIMGDWKCQRSYLFAGSTLWDSEGRRENYITLSGTTNSRYDASINNGSGSPRYRVYYTNADRTHNVRGGIVVTNMKGDITYTGFMRRYDSTPPTQGVTFDYIWNYTTNMIQRTADGDILSGETVKIVYTFVQEDLSMLPLPVQYKDPSTGAISSSVPASVAETDITGAWVEWEFDNEFRCDWYTGWISDIGLGAINIYLDGEVVHSISQTSAKTERFSQVSTDLIPGHHHIKLVQQRGRVNFDLFKLEDYQEEGTTRTIVASPSTNPHDLYSWMTSKAQPGITRKYLGRGAQCTTGAYDTLRVDPLNRLPDNHVPLKYRARFKTALEGREAPYNGGTGTGGELGDRVNRFEQGSIMLSAITFEKGVNPTYWRMAPGQDKYPGFAVEEWDSTRPNDTGLQTWHMADGSISAEKLKTFSITDLHVANNASIQESKLSLNFPTHTHTNMADIGDITDHHLDLLQAAETIVHRRPLYGLGDPQFQMENDSTWQLITTSLNPFAYGIPAAKTGAVRKYKLYAVYGDNIASSDSTLSPRLRLRDTDDGATAYEWNMPYSNATCDSRRDSYSPLFTYTDNGKNKNIQIRIQNDSSNYGGSPARAVGLNWLELIAYDIYE